MTAIARRHRIRIDGKLDDPAWKKAKWTSDFVDIEGAAKPTPRFRTRAKMLWDDKYLYIAAELEEPNVTGTLTKHDSVIFKDNDFEVFIKPLPQTESYYEFEMNALNTGWDLFLPKPYSEDGKADNSWDIAGLKTAVAVQGTLNNSTDTDRGWTLEIAYPLTAFDVAPASATASARNRVAHQLQPRGMEARQPEGRQLGLVAAGRHQHARAGSLGLPALPLSFCSIATQGCYLRRRHIDDTSTARDIVFRKIQARVEGTESAARQFGVRRRKNGRGRAPLHPTTVSQGLASASMQTSSRAARRLDPVTIACMSPLTTWHAALYASS